MPFSGLISPEGAGSVAGDAASVVVTSEEAGCSSAGLFLPDMAGLTAQNQVSSRARTTAATMISTPSQRSFFSLKAVRLRIKRIRAPRTRPFSRPTSIYQ